MSPDTMNAWINLSIGLSSVLAILWGVWLKVRKRVRASLTAHQARQASFDRLPEALDKLHTLDGYHFEKLERLEGMQTQLDSLTKQVSPDGGTSLADALQRIESVLQNQSDIQVLRGNQVQAIATQVSVMVATMVATSNTDPRKATFEANSEGLVTDANKTYMRWTGLQLPEVLGWGWINSVHPADRDAVRKEWKNAVAEHRMSTMRYRIMDTDGEVFEVEATATPIPEGQVPCDRWVGAIFRVEPGAKMYG